MATIYKKHENWSSRFTFLMAAVGAAVGLGNIWKFPYVAGQNGGSAFVLIYLLAVAFVALPILIAEIAMYGVAPSAAKVIGMLMVIGGMVLAQAVTRGTGESGRKVVPGRVGG